MSHVILTMNTPPQKITFRGPRWRTLLTVVFIGSMVASSSAQLVSWINPDDGFFEADTNWAPVGIPEANNSIIFGLPGDYQVGLLGHHTVDDVNFGNGTVVTLTRGGGTANDRQLTINGEATVESGRLNIGSPQEGGRLNVVVNESISVEGTNASPSELSVRNGSTLTSGDGNVATGDTTQGIVLIDGDHSLWNVGTSPLNIGANGFVTVDNGGTLVTFRSRVGRPGDSDVAVVTVKGVGSDGTPSRWMSVGEVELDQAELAIQGGAYVEHDTTIAGVYDAAEIRVEGTDTVGNPTRFSTKRFAMARFPSSEANLRIAGGAVVENEIVQSGNRGRARTEIVGADSAGNPTTWTITERLTLGAAALGVVVVEDGARLATGDTWLGGTAEGNGAVSVFGSAEYDSTWTNSGDVFVGGVPSVAGGNGFVGVGEHGEIRVDGRLHIWDEGQVDLTGGTISADTVVNVNGGSFDFESGTLEVERYEGDLANLGGIVAPGPTEAATTIIGNYAQHADARLLLDIGGVLPGSSHDLVNITGEANIDGSLDLRLSNGFVPSSEDVFTVLSSDLIVGLFDNVGTGERLTTMNGLGSFVVNYGVGSAMNESRVMLSDFMALSACDDNTAGDIDGNGTVEFADFLVLSGNFGDDVGDHTQGDIDCNGTVEFADFLVMSGNFGNTIGSAVSVPEPGGTVIFGMLIVFLGQLRFRDSTQNRRVR